MKNYAMFLLIMVVVYSCVLAKDKDSKVNEKKLLEYKEKMLLHYHNGRNRDAEEIKKELIKKGFVKINRFRSSDNKSVYMYILTPHGIEAKTKITVNFLKRKMNEYEKIKQEIKELKKEVEDEI